jgi:hypothetical protein
LAYTRWFSALKPISDLGFLMDKQFIGAIQSLNAETLCEELKPWQVEQGKAMFLDYLYDLYERDQAGPGLCGTYTGLFEKFIEDSGQILRASFITSQFPKAK